MGFHKNSTPAEGIFKGLEELTGALPDINFNPKQEEEMAQLLWECLIHEVAPWFSDDTQDKYLFGGDRVSLNVAVLDMGKYDEAVNALFEKTMTDSGEFSAMEIKSAGLRVRLALQQQFKLFFL